MDIAVMLDKMDDYNKVMSSFNFKQDGDGDKPWSLKFINKKTVVEIRNSEWTLTKSNSRSWTGKQPEELKKLLLGFLTKKELIM